MDECYNQDNLSAVPKGLTIEQAEQRLREHGTNTIKTGNSTSLVHAFLKWISSPVTLLFLAAMLLTFFLRESFEFTLITVLFIINTLVTVLLEFKADNALKTLQDHVLVTVAVLRSGSWKHIDAVYLVPGDIVQFGSGDVISVDATIVRCQSCLVNEAQLTGESLPIQKKQGDEVYSGTTLISGSAVCFVEKTGTKTKFGASLMLMDHAHKRSMLEEDIIRIAGFLSIFSIAMIALLGVYTVWQGDSLMLFATTAVALLIAGIPIGLPTIMTVIISLGVLKLARQGAVVRRLSSLEDLANVDLLLSDKTGTLTTGRITIVDVLPVDGISKEDVLALAQTTIDDGFHDLLALALHNSGKERTIPKGYTIERIIPGDSIRKRATSFLRLEGDSQLVVSVGAPQVIESLLNAKCERDSVEDRAMACASDGYRVLAVARAHGIQESGMTFIGFIVLADPLRDQAGSVISYLKREGIRTMLVSGDANEVVTHLAHKIGLSGKVVVASRLENLTAHSFSWSSFDDVSGFAEVLPDDKLRLVEAAKKEHTLAVTGDGANDLAALRSADIGIAVSNAVTALKQSADIVLVGEGISAIKTAIHQAREIFERIYTYSVYRISESLRVILSIAILIVLYGTFPLTPLQLILLAILNDVPIVSLAINRVADVSKPAHAKVRERFLVSSLYSLVGVTSSVLLFVVLKTIPIADGVLSSAFFLKLAVSGHLLIFIVHTRTVWWKFLPSTPVIVSTLLTQVLASLCAYFGLFMDAVPLWLILFVWIWGFLWMQLLVIVKHLLYHYKFISST